MLAILQARTSSRRLPGKVLMDVCGAPMIARQIERLRRASAITTLVIATSDDASDDPLQKLGEGLGVPVVRGSLDDVLARFIGALDAIDPNTEHLFRLTADCPLADPALIDEAAAAHLTMGADLTHVQESWTYPKGVDLELVRASSLRAAAVEAVDPYEREHVTPFIHRRPDRFAIRSLKHDPPLRYRWTVDTPEDFAFVQAVYTDLYAVDPAFTSTDILAWQAAHPGRVLVHTP